MPLETSTEIISQTAREIFETMFFVSPDDIAAPEEWTTPTTRATVEFRGARSGWFEIRLEQQFAQELAAGFSGTFDPSAMQPEEVPQIVCELANMVCGATLSRMEPGALFDLDSPRISEPDEIEARPAQIVQWLDSGQGLIRLALQWT